MTRDPNGALLERAELPALADPEGDGEPYRDVVWELHQRGGADVYERAIDLERLSELIHPPSDDVRWALASCLGASAAPEGGTRERFWARALSD